MSRTEQNLTYDINYSKYLQFIERTQENSENSDMGMHDISASVPLPFPQSRLRDAFDIYYWVKRDTTSYEYKIKI